ncbi:MAG: hypothetical protein OJI67_00970, partial [Prosthecobacter sp.]|nr:hypothetical protein [Prosthecobacter sp.]
MVLDISWASPSSSKPELSVEILPVQGFAPNPALQAMVESAKSVLDHLKNTQLCKIPADFRPLSSYQSRERLCSMA